MISPLVGVTTEFSPSLHLRSSACGYLHLRCLPARDPGPAAAQFRTWRDGGLHPPKPSPPSGLIVRSNLIQPHLKKKRPDPRESRDLPKVIQQDSGEAEA